MEALAIPDTRERLHDAVDALVGESIDGFTTQALGEDIVGMRREIDRLEAEFLRRLHRFDAGHGALAENLSTVSWLRAGCGMTAKAAAYRVHLARSLGELPAAWAPDAASSPNAEPPDKVMASMPSTVCAGSRRAVSRVPGPPPRTSIDATAGSSKMTTVDPEPSRKSSAWPTLSPGTSVIRLRMNNLFPLRGERSSERSERG